MKLDWSSINNVNKNDFLGAFSVLAGWAPRVNDVICSGHQHRAVEAARIHVRENGSRAGQRAALASGFGCPSV